MDQRREGRDGDRGAQVRGDIESGDGADKRPGFDPAAAPLETDAEAAGAPVSGEEAATARATQPRREGAEAGVTYGPAMRAWNRRPDGGARLSIGLVSVVLVAVVLLVAVLVL